MGHNKKNKYHLFISVCELCYCVSISIMIGIHIHNVNYRVIHNMDINMLTSVGLIDQECLFYFSNKPAMSYLLT